MNSYDQYYRENLYPLQDGVMSIIGKLNTPFFLTGGTALSRHYTNHRYSDDLDLFLVSNEIYHIWVDKVLDELFRAESESAIMVDRTSVKRFKDFTQLFVSTSIKPQHLLKLDLVNDLAVHYGDFENDERLGVIDSWRNILSNKISALFRFEPKDVSDIWILSKTKHFHWRTIIEEAKSKEAGVEPEIIYNILRSFPIDKFDMVRWVKKPDYTAAKKDLDRIADDLFFARDNSLAL
jgi:hypothetical protein